MYLSWLTLRSITFPVIPSARISNNVNKKYFPKSFHIKDDILKDDWEMADLQFADGIVILLMM